jgi:hypothetical protein
MTVNTQADATTTTAVEQAHLYRYKVSYDASTKSVQPSVTIYSNDLETAINEGAEIFSRVVQKIKEKGFKVGDFESNEMELVR